MLYEIIHWIAFYHFTMQDGTEHFPYIFPWLLQYEDLERSCIKYEIFI